MLNINYQFLIETFLFGCVIAAAVGPIAIIIVNASIKISKRTGMICSFAASTADAICGFISFFLYGSIVEVVSAHSRTIKLSSSLLLIALGTYIMFSALRARKKGEDDNIVGLDIIKNSPFISVFFLTIASPMTIPGFIAFIGAIKAEISTADKIAGPIAIFLGGIMIQAVMVFFADATKKYLLRGNVLKYINILSGFCIIAFGIKELVW